MKQLHTSSSHHEDTAPCLFAPLLPYDPSQPKKQPQHKELPENFPGLPKDWVAEFETFASSDGKETLFSYFLRPLDFRPTKKPQKVLVIFHGQGEHGGRYFHWPYYLGDEISAFYILEHRGHGHSTGSRGHVDHFDRYADDAALAINRLHEFLLDRLGQSEIHLLGHSMGGLIALRTLLLYPELPVSSVVVSNPMIELAFSVPSIKLLAGKALHKILPAISMASPSLWNKVSKDESVCQHYRLDPMNHSKTSPAFFFSYQDVKSDLLKNAKKIAVPCFVMVGMDDLIIAPDSVIDLYGKLKVKGKRLKKYPEMYHELFNEPEKQTVFDDLKSWLRENPKA